ncbi:MAG: hypothetical protein ACLQPD_07850 [Desulfomonilaceae bacterium]
MTVINRNDAPNHLFNIPELDFSRDLFAEPLGGSWFTLGTWTIKPRRDERGVEDTVQRQSLLIAPGQFEEIFEYLKSVGNVIHNLGQPGGSINYRGGAEEYKYIPFYQFEVSGALPPGEPLVFLRSATSGNRLFINPDLSLYFELEEKKCGSGIWSDPRRGVDALVHRNRGNLEVVEIQVDYLREYLQARQMSLLIGHYRHLHLFDPPESAIERFVVGEVILGSPGQGAKAILQNWGLRQSITGAPPFLQRRLHFWLEIRPQEIDVDDPWAEEPPFDPYTFVLPTRVGQVAPARWAHFRQTEELKFQGEVCDFMTPVYFRQEVLTKYQGAPGFDLEDNGAISCYNYWGLVRSTARVGNELLATGIGDFAEGVPFEEWPHWKQYAVEPPSPETAKALGQEQTVPDAVNCLVKALDTLNIAFANMAASIGMGTLTSLWGGSLDSLAGRHLKWVYPTNADEDEFLKRATLISTLALESLESASLRNLLKGVGSSLHMNDEEPPQPLGSRNLLQRLTLIAALIENFQPDIAGIPMLVRQAEGKIRITGKLDLQAELEILHRRVREELAPLAFLYDLRTHGGLAHAPNKERVATAAAKLGLPEKNWHRTDYLRLLNIVTDGVYHIVRHLEMATEIIASGGLCEPE